MIFRNYERVMCMNLVMLIHENWYSYSNKIVIQFNCDKQIYLIDNTNDNNNVNTNR